MNEKIKIGREICKKNVAKFSVFDIPKEIIEEIINKTIEEALIIPEEFNNLVKRIFIRNIQEELKQNFLIINRYINEHFYIGKTQVQSVYILRKIAILLNKIFDRNLIDCMDEILDIEIIKQNLKNIIDNNTRIINSKALAKYANNEIMLIMLQAYCDKHSIEIIDECKEETAHLDSLKSYLDEVSKIPLLTKEEETELGLRILKNDQSAINELVIHNLRLVIKKANRCKHKEKVEILDIIQYGNEGLIEAAKRFDVTKGFRFATYAMWWIYESIDNSIHKDIYTSRISSTKSAYLKVKQYRKAYVDMESKLCREPILEEIAKKMRITVESLKEIISLSTSIDLESLNSQINYGDEEMELLLTIPSTEASIEELIERKDLKSRIIYYLDKMNLTPNQYYVLILRMGLYNEKLYTLDLISKKLNLTRERIRQLEKNAVKKIIFSPYVYPFAKEMLDQYKKGLLYIEQIKPKFIENDKIFNYFRYIDKETIISIIQTLDEETQEIIYKKLGPFLDKPNVVLTDVEECDLFYKGIYDMQKRIEQVNLQKEKKKIRKF